MRYLYILAVFPAFAYADRYGMSEEGAGRQLPLSALIFLLAASWFAVSDNSPFSEWTKKNVGLSMVLVFGGALAIAFIDS